MGGGASEPNQIIYVCLPNSLLCFTNMFYKSWVVLSDQFVIQNVIFLVKTKNAYKALKRKLNHWHYGSRKNSYFSKLGILSQHGGCLQHYFRSVCKTFLGVRATLFQKCVQHYSRSVCNTILGVCVTLS